MNIKKGIERLLNRALSEAEQEAMTELCNTKDLRFIDQYIQQAQSMCIRNFLRTMETMIYEIRDLED